MINIVMAFGRNISSELQEKLTAEQRRLSDKHEGRSTYCLNRTVVADFADSEIRKIKSTGEILEIGCGTGQAVRRLLSNHPDLPPTRITATCLNALPEHQELIDRGVGLSPNTIAEELPPSWKGRFKVVLASASLQWTDAQKALPQVARVIAPGGSLVGFDTRPTVAAIEEAAPSLGLEKELETDDTTRWQERAHGLVPFRFRKVEKSSNK